MTQQFSKTDEPWSRIPAFEHEDTRISVITYSGDDHSAATTVFSTGDSEVFHADKHCHRLHTKKPFAGRDGPERMIYAHVLEKVMSSYTSPIRPCGHCTQDINTTAEIVREIDGVPEVCLSYFDPGDDIVKTQVRTDHETGETTVKESTRPAYPSGGTAGGDDE